MGRRTRRRWVREPPNNFYFTSKKPSLEDCIILTIVEFEALRLKHYIQLDQKEAAKKMDVSQPTFSRIIESAHKKSTLALIEGKPIKIYGGNFNYKKGFIGYGCINCNHEWIDKDADRNKNASCPKCNLKNVYYLEKQPL